MYLQFFMESFKKKCEELLGIIKINHTENFDSELHSVKLISIYLIHMLPVLSKRKYA